MDLNIKWAVCYACSPQLSIWSLKSVAWFSWAWSYGRSVPQVFITMFNLSSQLLFVYTSRNSSHINKWTLCFHKDTVITSTWDPVIIWQSTCQVNCRWLSGLYLGWKREQMILVVNLNSLKMCALKCGIILFLICCVGAQN